MCLLKQIDVISQTVTMERIVAIQIAKKIFFAIYCSVLASPEESILRSFGSVPCLENSKRACQEYFGKQGRIVFYKAEPVILICILTNHRCNHDLT